MQETAAAKNIWPTTCWSGSGPIPYDTVNSHHPTRD